MQTSKEISARKIIFVADIPLLNFCVSTKISFIKITLQGKNILAVNVEEGCNKPYKDLNGNIWVKQGADKRRITENSEILRLFSQSKTFLPDETSVPGTSIDDLDNNLIDSYLEHVYNKRRSDFNLEFSKL